jgi:lipoprotein-releasing system ATP-binding protein
MDNMKNNIITCENLNLSFQDTGVETIVLKNLNLSVSQGESVAIIGASGSGKSSLLNLIGGIDNNHTGSVKLMNQNLSELSETKRCQLRNQHLGFIYQFHHLLGEFSALENVMMPLLINGTKTSVAKEQATDLLTQINLANRMEHKPSELSGGERQRVSICRALITKPSCILADEPTGNLDKQNSLDAFDMMLNIKNAQNSALIIVTHDLDLAKKMDRTLTLINGSLSTVTT